MLGTCQMLIHTILLPVLPESYLAPPSVNSFRLTCQLHSMRDDYRRRGRVHEEKSPILSTLIVLSKLHDVNRNNYMDGEVDGVLSATPDTTKINHQNKITRARLFSYSSSSQFGKSDYEFVYHRIDSPSRNRVRDQSLRQQRQVELLQEVKQNNKQKIGI